MLPLENPLGLGPGDLFEIALAAFLVALAVAWPRWIGPIARRLAPKTAWCMLLLAVLPVALRLVMLAQHPVPSPEVYDEFGHLFVADTLRHLRLANPPHPLHQFFETFFVLQTPSYASIYPIGQGLILAIGRAVFGLPWVGVLLTVAAMCALCYWMLRGWTTPEWALLGGIVAVVEFGPLCAWTNSYWGGSLVAVAGCLVFGSLPRLRKAPRVRYGALAGLGIGLHWLTRPYETIFLILAAVLFLAPNFRRMLKPAVAATVVLIPAIAISLAHNKAVTGAWTTMPYQLSRYQYGVPVAFTWQPNVQPHNELTREQQLQYKMQTSFRANGAESVPTYFERLAYRVRFYRFFFLPALYVALPFFLLKLRDRRYVWVAATLVIFALGVNFYPFFETHYLGALTSLFVLVSIVGLQQLKYGAAELIVFLCVAHFVFWYGRSFFEPWAPSPRAAIQQQLEKLPGQQLVFVRYWPQHRFQNEWVYNDADMDRAKIVWARDLGDAEDKQLLAYFPHRTAWLLESDAAPPKLNRYQPEPEIYKPAPRPTVTKPTPPLRFEDVK